MTEECRESNSRKLFLTILKPLWYIYNVINGLDRTITLQIMGLHRLNSPQAMRPAGDTAARGV